MANISGLSLAARSKAAVTVVALLTLGVSMELWRVVQRTRCSSIKGLLLPGLALQRLTTREPRLEETRIALTAVASVLRRELA